MRFKDFVLNESAQVKFAALERKMRSENTTVSEFIELMRKHYSVHTILNLDDSVDPFYADGAEITTRRHSVQSKTATAPREAHGKYVMTINVGPGSSRGNLPVKEITNFLRLVRHELSHAYQSMGGFHADGDYHNVDSSHGARNPIQQAMYFLQSSERSQQVVDLATHLSNLGATPANFFNLLNQAKEYLRGAVGDVEDTRAIKFKELRIRLRRMVFDELKKTTGSKSEDSKRGFDHAYYFISQYVEAFSFASLSKEDTFFFKQKINAFKRALLKNFKSVDAIETSNRDDSITSHKKNNPKRIRQRENRKLRRRMDLEDRESTRDS